MPGSPTPPFPKSMWTESATTDALRQKRKNMHPSTRIFCLLMVAVLGTLAPEQLHAQSAAEIPSVRVPRNYRLVAIEDYAPYKDSVQQVCTWLMASPLDVQRYKRQQAFEFMMDWINGAPYTHIELAAEVLVPIAEEADAACANEWTMLYIAGMVDARIADADLPFAKAQEAGLKALMQGYGHSAEICPSAFLKQLQKAHRKDKLDTWVAKHITPPAK